MVAHNPASHRLHVCPKWLSLLGSGLNNVAFATTVEEYAGTLAYYSVECVQGEEHPSEAVDVNEFSVFLLLMMQPGFTSLVHA